MTSPLQIRPVLETDLDEADRIFRLAFGTFMGMPDPTQFAGDSDWIRTRWRANPSNALAALAGDRLAGTNFITRWGSFGFFGPLTVHPDYWDRGVGKQLLGPTIDLLESWGLAQMGLYTFSQSPKHVSLYQKYGFRPRFLTPVMLKKLGDAPAQPPSARKLSDSKQDQSGFIAACNAVADANFSGLDLRHEIDAVAKQKLGDTLLLDGGEGFAVCHTGKGSEAGTDVCYVKFAAVRPGAGAENNLSNLLAAAEAFARGQGAKVIIAGVNTARTAAYETLQRSGYRIQYQGIAMHRPNDPAFSRPDAMIIDDWR